MSVNDVLSDMIARVNNAGKVQHSEARVIKSKLILAVLKILNEEGFINGFKEDGNYVIVSLKYDSNRPIIKEFKRVSKPGRRVYSDITDLPKYYNGLGIAILSTSKGVVADHQARKLNVGGEILCFVF